MVARGSRTRCIRTRRRRRSRAAGVAASRRCQWGYRGSSWRSHIIDMEILVSIERLDEGRGGQCSKTQARSICYGRLSLLMSSPRVIAQVLRRSTSTPQPHCSSPATHELYEALAAACRHSASSMGLCGEKRQSNSTPTRTTSLQIPPVLVLLGAGRRLASFPKTPTKSSQVCQPRWFH